MNTMSNIAIMCTQLQRSDYPSRQAMRRHAMELLARAESNARKTARKEAGKALEKRQNGAANLKLMAARAAVSKLSRTPVTMTKERKIRTGNFNFA